MITLVAGTHGSLAFVTKLMQGVPWNITEVVTDCPTVAHWAKTLRRVPVHILADGPTPSAAAAVAIWDGGVGPIADAISIAKREGWPCLVYVGPKG